MQLNWRSYVVGNSVVNKLTFIFDSLLDSSSYKYEIMVEQSLLFHYLRLCELQYYGRVMHLL